MNLEVFVLGTGGMMPLPHRHLTSVMLRREGDLFLFDCGEGTQVALRKLSLKWKKINVILISHTHADHITGLPGILMLSSQVERDEPLYIIGPPKTNEFFQSMKKSLEMYINYPIIIQEIRNPGEPAVVFETKEYFIRSFPLSHSRTCVGYSFVEKDRPGEFFPDRAIAMGVPRGKLWSTLQGGQEVVLDGENTVRPSDVLGPPRPGRKVSYVTDTLYLPSIAKEVEGSDLLFCEGMFLEEHQQTAREKKHMTGKQGAKIGKEAQAKMVGLIHFSPRYTEKELKLLEKEAQSEYEGCFLTKDGQIIILENQTS